MCRKSDISAGSLCTALDSDKRKWDKDCLLRPKGDADPNKQIDKFVTALEGLCAEAVLSTSKLHSLEEAAAHDKFKEWYIKHGKMSGNFRTSVNKSKIPSFPPVDKNKISRDLLNTILKRDNYRCQYCGCRLIVREVWEYLEKLSSSHGRNLIKKLNQRQGVKDIDVSGLVFATWPFLDHVIPHKRRGSTTAENLVAACFACNYGKDNYTCEELGIFNPLNNKKMAIVYADSSQWRGLENYRTQLETF